MSGDNETRVWPYVVGGISVAAATVGAIELMRRAPWETWEPGSFDFPFEDERRLARGQKNGGRVYVPPGTRGRPTVMVWLHGNNEGASLHRGLGGGGSDLRTTLPSGFILAAPSQSVSAKGPSLWGGFDLDRFLDAVDAALGKKVDRSDVVLMGHSGAGCSMGSGLHSKFDRTMPKKIVLVDTCLSPELGASLAKMADRTKVYAYYQPKTWKRDFAGFGRALGGKGVFEEIAVPGAGNAHEDIVPLAVAKALSA